MVRRDLEAAQIPQLDEFDRPWLFHELRHQFATRLAGAGIHPQIAQQLLDHSSVDLTMNVYTHTGLAERALAVNTMPSFARPDLR
jgi:integrase|tara:strand:- start:329 stop:583 length:255 start_codon:yes stop_codon:yes gene_type:complete